MSETSAQIIDRYIARLSDEPLPGHTAIAKGMTAHSDEINFQKKSETIPAHEVTQVLTALGIELQTIQYNENRLAVEPADFERFLTAARKHLREKGMSEDVINNTLSENALRTIRSRLRTQE